MYAEAPLEKFAWRAWAQIHDGRGRVSVDPTWRQVRVTVVEVDTGR